MTNNCTNGNSNDCLLGIKFSYWVRIFPPASGLKDKECHRCAYNEFKKVLNENGRYLYPVRYYYTPNGVCGSVKDYKDLDYNNNIYFIDE